MFDCVSVLFLFCFVDHSTEGKGCLGCCCGIPSSKLNGFLSSSYLFKDFFLNHEQKEVMMKFGLFSMVCSLLLLFASPASSTIENRDYVCSFKWSSIKQFTSYSKCNIAIANTLTGDE